VEAYRAGCRSLIGRLILGVWNSAREQKGDGLIFWNQLVQKLEPLGVERSIENAHAGRITARPIETCDKPDPDGSALPLWSRQAAFAEKLARGPSIAHAATKQLDC